MGRYILWVVLTALVAGCSGGSGEHDDEDGRTSATRVVSGTSSHSSVAPGTCNTCHNGTTARGKSSSHILTTASCDTCHSTTGWIPTTTGASSISTIDFPVEAVFASLASTTSTFNASATDAAGNSFFLLVNSIPGPDKIDPLIYAASLKTYLQSNILKKNGIVTSTKNFENFYLVAPFYLFGSLNNMYGSSNNMKVITHFPLPSTSRVGTAGAFYNGKNYISSSTLPPDTWSATWSLEADSATTAWLCLNVAITPANGSAASTAETDCFRINQAGDISGFKADITENGIKLNYR